MLPADPTSTADTSHVILPVAASTYTSPPHGDPDPGTPAPKWPGPRDPSAKLARTPDPGPRPGPRTTRRFWAFGALTTSARGCQGCAFVFFYGRRLDF